MKQTACDLVLRALRDEWWPIRKSAAEAMPEVASGTEAEVLALAALLMDEEPQVIPTVLLSLGDFGPRAKVAVPLLREFLLTRESPMTRRVVLNQIERIEGASRGTGSK